MRAKSKPPASRKEARVDLGTLGVLMNDHQTDQKMTRAGILVAIAVHVVAFAMTWPSIAGPAPEPPEPQIVRVVQLHIYEPPEKRQVELPELPDIVRIPIPDPDPNNPEPFREPRVEQPEIDLGDIVRGDVFTPEPPPDPVDDGPKTVGVDIQPPERIHFVPPQYTNTAMKVREEGTVVLELTIDKTGVVTEVKVLKSLRFGLTENAVKAARQWRFEPSKVNGKPVPVLYTLSVIFTVT